MAVTAIITFVAGFDVLGYLAVRIGAEHPPISRQVGGPDGATQFTADDVMTGGVLVADLSGDGAPEVVFATYSTRANASHLFVLDAGGNQHDLDYRRMMTIVLDAGFRGYCGIEHGREGTEAEDIQTVKRHLEETRDALQASYG